MASTFSDLGIELMATGENAGTWGDKTNTNLQIVEKAIAGYVEKSIAGGAQTTALSITDGTTTESDSIARHAVIKLTGSITGNQIVTVPDSIEKVYIITNGTSGAYTVQFKTASGTGITFGVSEKTTRLVYSDGTNLVDAGFGGALDIEGRELVLDADGDTTITADTDDQIDIKIGGTDQIKLVDGAIVPVTDNDIDLGTSSLEFKDAFFDGTVTADAFAGPLTGDVTGNISGTAATVTGAAQSNITSLGTLTTLTVDNVIINGSTIGHTGDTDLITVASGIATVAGEVSMTTLDIGGTNVTSTAAELNILDGVTSTATELNIIDGNATVGTTAFADGDGIVTNDNGTMRQTSATTLKTYIADVTLTTAAQTNITSLGTLSALTVDDVAIDGKVVTMTGSSGDTFVTTVAANGATSLVTTDTAAAAANLTITADGTVGINSTGDMTLDSSADIVLDAAGGDLSFKQAGTEILRISNTSTNAVLQNRVDSADIIFKQADGTETLRLDDDTTVKVATDLTIGDDASLISDAAVLNFGANSEIKLIHTADTGLILKHTATADDKPVSLTLQTGETDMAANDVIGKIDFQAPDEGTGTDAILVAAGIEAVAEGDFSSSSNATKLSFKTGASETAAEKMSLSSAGVLTVSSTITADSKDVILGKIEGTNFTDSLLIGHATTGTLDAAEDNTGVGIGALDALTSGDRNTALGSEAGTALTTANNNTLIGYEAGKGVVGANQNTAIGDNAFAGTNTDSNSASNTVVGAFAMNVSSGAKENTAIGRDAGREVTTGDGNIFIGYNAGANDSTSGITTGSGNVIIGTIDPDSRTGDRQLKIAGNDGSTTTTWISGDSNGIVTFAHDVILANDSFVQFGDAGEKITGDGTFLTITSSNKVVIDAETDIHLDANGVGGSGGGDILFQDNGTTFLKSSNNTAVEILSTVSDQDLSIRGNDGGSEITALSFDMSDAGTATFNHNVHLSTADARMGIGTTSPQRSLEISQAIPVIRMTDTDASAGYMEMGNGGSEFKFDLDKDDALDSSILTFKVDGSYVMKFRDGASEFADGTASNPSITNIGDINTGLFFSAADTMAFSAGGTSQFTMADGVIAPVTDSDVDLGTTSLRFKDTFVDTVTSTSTITTGAGIVIADSGNIGSASDTDAIAIGSDGDVTLTQDLELQHDGAILSFGANDEVTLTHVHNDGLLLNADMQLQFRDSAINIRSDADGDLDINADDEVEINSTLIDINGNVEMSGTLAQTGVATFAVAANVAQVALSSSSNAVAWDASAAANAFHVTTENTTFSAPSNAVEGAFICLEINYNGSHTIAFNTVFEFAASTAPTTTDTDGKTDILVFRYNGAVWQEVGRTLNLSES